jgi:hypothetical protein
LADQQRKRTLETLQTEIQRLVSTMSEQPDITAEVLIRPAARPDLLPQPCGHTSPIAALLSLAQNVASALAELRGFISPPSGSRPLVLLLGF